LSTVCEQSKYHHVRLSSLSSFIHRPNNRLLLVTLPSSSPPHLFTSAHLIRYDHLHTSIPKLMPFALTKLSLLIGRHVLALFFSLLFFSFFSRSRKRCIANARPTMHEFQGWLSCFFLLRLACSLSGSTVVWCGRPGSIVCDAIPKPLWDIIMLLC
jgi:hypothetical protein